MADSKITALAALTAADPVNDMFPVVDVSDTSMAASGTTKRISVNNILGASGTATLASATITGAATVGTTLGVTGVSTLASLGVTGAATVGTTLVVGTNTTLTNGNVIIGTSGKGIDFSATTSGTGTMTSELLNDYEEGTWVPTLTFATPGTLAVTYGVRTGNYTKVGNLVTARFKIEIAPAGFVKGTASGGVKITGLPFTASGTGTQYVDLAASLTDQTSGSLAICYPSSTDIFFEQTQVTGTRVIRSSAAIDASNFAATNTGYISLVVVLTYTV
jgi:hypothetical protein